MQRRLNLYLLAFGLLLAITPKPLLGQTFTTIDFPGAVGTLATGINGSGAIVGDFGNKSGHIQGFLFSGGTFTEIECPSAQFTRPTGVNDNGNIVGFCESSDSKFHGFLLSGGVFTFIDFPGAVETRALGNNDAGDIVGGYCAAQNATKCSFTADNMHGFLLSGGAFTTIDFPGAVFTEAWRINDLGEILGRYLNPDGMFHLFLLSNGSFTSVPDPPGAIETAFDGTFVGGLDKNGDIVSDYCNLAPCPSSPSEFFTVPGSHGFLLRDGKYTTIDFPGAFNTVGFGINDAGEIVGGYFDQNGHDHGFLRTP